MTFADLSCRLYAYKNQISLENNMYGTFQFQKGQVASISCRICFPHLSNLNQLACKVDFKINQKWHVTLVIVIMHLLINRYFMSRLWMYLLFHYDKKIHMNIVVRKIVSSHLILRLYLITHETYVKCLHKNYHKLVL